MRCPFRLSLVFTAAVVSLGGARLAAAQAVAPDAASSATAAAAAVDLKMFPAPQPGMQRAVISLPPADLEDDLRVQVIVGKTMPVDCNVHTFPARLQHDTVQGWGYPYYRVTDVGPVAATRMACAPSATPQTAFVIGSGEGFLLRYNSRLPVVVYAPDGYEVRYRLWQGSNEVGRAVVR